MRGLAYLMYLFRTCGDSERLGRFCRAFGGQDVGLEPGVLKSVETVRKWLEKETI